MIQPLRKDQILECVNVIQKSFQTVADEFGITAINAPRFTAFSMCKERLAAQMEAHLAMFAAMDENDRITGYYSLGSMSEKECELNNLCVLPEFRHQRIGEQLIKHAFNTAKGLGYECMYIGIVEENTTLKEWYQSFGAVHIGTKKFDFFPFTCGYLKKDLK